MNTVTAKLFDGKSKVETSDIRDRIKTFEDACREIEVFPSDLTLQGVGVTDDDLKAISAFHKLTIVAKALNEGWKPDWNNDDEYKYYPYFDMQNGFVFDDYDVIIQISFVGSRLCFKNSELAEYAGKQFLDLYKDLFTF